MMGFIFSVPEICPIDSMIGKASGMTLWIFVVYFLSDFSASKLWESVDPHGFCGPVAWHDKSLPGEASDNVKFKLAS